jgi:hypothetical protein
MKTLPGNDRSRAIGEEQHMSIFPSSNPFEDAFARATQQARTRSSWNDRLEHWERPASESEEDQIQRAARMVREALTASTILTAEGISIAPQGSYYNNTNVRLESDIDLRVAHPALRLEYANDVLVDTARAALGISGEGRSYGQIKDLVRSETIRSLSMVFGAGSVDTSGSKAIRLKKRPGTRADVDIIPVFRYYWVTWRADEVRYHVEEGITFLTGSDVWIYNFPEQHYANGVAKRGRTAHHFKKVVRSLKRLRDELVEAGALGEKQAPSFFIECLTYAVEDAFFTVDGDDRYDRLRRILRRSAQQLADQNWTNQATEINGIKYLFRPSQPWTVNDAKMFVSTALARLEA